MADNMEAVSLFRNMLSYILPATLFFHTTFELILPVVLSNTPSLTPANIMSLSNTHCVVAISNSGLGLDWLEQTTETESSTPDLLVFAKMAFQSEPDIFWGICDLKNFIWPLGKRLELFEAKEMSDVTAVVFPRQVKDRTCLQMPKNHVVYPVPHPYKGPNSPDVFVKFVNKYCNTFRTPDGNLTFQGLHHEYLLKNLFSVKQTLKSLTVTEIFKTQNLKETRDYCLRANVTDKKLCTDNSTKTSTKIYENVPKCEQISLPSKKEFFMDYLSRSKPVIITGSMLKWPAVLKWTNDFLRNQYGEKDVHIKLTPKGEYEGVEPAGIWETYGIFKIPQEVLKQLSYPDLVVVRAAELGMKFSEFLSLVQSISNGTYSNVSAYLEYTSIDDYFPELKEDLTEMPFVKELLKLVHLNIWLSDGNTLGKLHFDPFDNLLCQISGEKEVMLFEPHNNFLYEAHIPEAILSYNSTLKAFRRSKLLDSTSMVMSPVDILQPHFERFPRFGEARPMMCTIREGDVLFMPAFWWHEVQSRPSPSEQRNLAVNFWYEPFLKKEFPCPDCQLDVNPEYTHLL